MYAIRSVSFSFVCAKANGPLIAEVGSDERETGGPEEGERVRAYYLFKKNLITRTQRTPRGRAHNVTVFPAKFGVLKVKKTYSRKNTPSSRHLLA